MEKSFKNAKIENSFIDQYNYYLVHIYAEHNNKASEIITKYKPEAPISENDKLLIKTHESISNLLYERIQTLQNDKINFSTPKFKLEAELLSKSQNINPLILLPQLEKVIKSIEPSQEEINKMYNSFSEQNDKVDIKIDLKAERLSEFNHPIAKLNDSVKKERFVESTESNQNIDKSIKIPDRNEIAQNPNEFEAEKGIDKNGVNEAPAKSINTIAEDYIKGQEKEIQQRISLADHFSEKENKISQKR